MSLAMTWEMMPPVGYSSWRTRFSTGRDKTKRRLLMAAVTWYVPYCAVPEETLIVS